MESSTYMMLLSFCLGIGLAASAGFRLFIPLFILSLGGQYGFELSENWAWLGSRTATLIFGIAMVIEILAYYIPWVDNALDTISVPLAGIAGTVIMGISMSGMESEIFQWILSIIAGGGTAAAIKGSVASGRLASTATTAGLGNIFVSSVETFLSIIMGIISFLFPVIAFVAVVLLFLSLYKGWNLLMRRSKKRA